MNDRGNKRGHESFYKADLAITVDLTECTCLIGYPYLTHVCRHIKSTGRRHKHTLLIHLGGSEDATVLWLKSRIH
jgi:hypothetical protein